MKNNNLPKGWEIKKLGEVCEIRSGRDYKKIINSKGKYPILGSAGKTMGFTNEYICKEGTTIIGRKGTINSPIFIETKFWNVDTAFGFHALEKLDKKFLFLFCQNFDFTDLDKGSGRPSLVKKDLLKIQIPIPPLPEQQRIVKLLDNAFVAIDKAKQNAEQNLRNAKEVFENYLQGVFENKGVDWEDKALGDEKLLKIIDGDRGKNYPRKSDFKDDGFCLFMNTKNVRTDGFLFESKMYITREKDESMGKGKLARKDVVLTTRGTIGNIGIYNEDVPYENIRINSGMLIFRPNQKVVTSQYLFELLRSGIMKDLIKRHVSGAAQPQLPIKTLISFIFPIPNSLQEQRQIVKKLNSLSAETKKLESIYQQKIDNLEELKKSLLQKAFRGEL